MEQIYYDEEFLTKEEIEKVEEEFKKFNWELVASTFEGDENATKHWDKRLRSNVINDIFKNKIQSFLRKQIETLVIYANGNTHGQCGKTHSDAPKEFEGDYYTLVYYFHKNWIPEYGGHLIIMDFDGKIIENIFPKSNSAVLFDSKLPHCPLEPTIHCKDMRISIAYKFRIIGDLL